ncbi:MAG: sulfite exporter TauE/SafE family protein [Thermoleophilia bacterium]|nr:sulfite exporter TauE/SafE family protein [Thermoleophilia bacterium]
MDFLSYQFPASGVETNVLLPPLVALIISFFTSMSGVSGAFLLLPFQMSFLGYTSPSVSGTNLVFNIVAIPSGVYQYIKEGRMAWPLTWIVLAGTLPGVFAGYFIRVHYFPDPRTFKLFAGLVLLYLGGRLLYGMTGRAGSAAAARVSALEERFSQRQKEKRDVRRSVRGLPADARVKTVSISLSRVTYEFWGETYSFSTPGMFLLSLAVGIAGGIYGIGGGAIIAPFCVAVFHLPVYTVAGAALAGTLLTSVAGVAFYSLIPSPEGIATAPDWRLGILFGVGGFIGIYLGARFQKYIPQKPIKLMLTAIILFVAVGYIIQFF